MLFDPSNGDLLLSSGTRIISIRRFSLGLPPMSTACSGHGADLRRMMESADFADVTFLVGKGRESIAAHKALLAARSEYFSKMFISEFSEGQHAAAIVEVPVPEAHPESF